MSAANWAVLGAVLLAVRHAPQHAWSFAGLGVLAALAGDRAVRLLALAAGAQGWCDAGWAGSAARGRPASLRRFHAAYAVYGRDRRGLLAAAGLAVAEHGVQMLLVLAIARSLDVAAGPVVLLGAAALFLLVLRLPLAPDGWGVGELSAVGLLGLAGVGAGAAFSVSLVNHAVLMLALAPGAALLLFRAGAAGGAARDRWRRGAGPAGRGTGPATPARADPAPGDGSPRRRPPRGGRAALDRGDHRPEERRNPVVRRPAPLPGVPARRPPAPGSAPPGRSCRPGPSSRTRPVGGPTSSRRCCSTTAARSGGSPGGERGLDGQARRPGRRHPERVDAVG